MERGKEFEKDENIARALEFYNNAVELDPLNKAAYTARGSLLIKQVIYSINHRIDLKMQSRN